MVFSKDDGVLERMNGFWENGGECSFKNNDNLNDKVGQGVVAVDLQIGVPDLEHQLVDRAGRFIGAVRTLFIKI
jgi:hypothetical protein